MKFSVEADKLHQALSNIVSLTSPLDNKLILSHVLFSLDDKTDKLSLFAFDGENWGVAGVQASNVSRDSKKSRLLVQADSLMDFLATFSEAELSFEQIDNECLIVPEGTKHIIRLQCPNVADFPEFPKFTNLKWTSVPSDALLDASDHVFPSRNTDKERLPDLLGVEFKDDRLVAGNGIVISRGVLTAKLPHMILTEKACAELLRLLKLKEKDVKVGRSDDHLLFKVGETLLVTKMRMGKDMSAADVVIDNCEKGHKYVLEISTLSLLKALSVVKTTTTKQDRRVILKMTKDVLTLRSNRYDGSSSVSEVPASWNGPEYEIVVNIDWLVSAIKSLFGKVEKTVFRFAEKSLAPVLIQNGSRTTVLQSIYTKTSIEKRETVKAA